MLGFSHVLFRLPSLDCQTVMSRSEVSCRYWFTTAVETWEFFRTASAGSILEKTSLKMKNLVNTGSLQQSKPESFRTASAGSTFEKTFLKLKNLVDTGSLQQSKHESFRTASAGSIFEKTFLKLKNVVDTGSLQQSKHEFLYCKCRQYCVEYWFTTAVDSNCKCRQYFTLLPRVGQTIPLCVTRGVLRSWEIKFRRKQVFILSSSLAG